MADVYDIHGHGESIYNIIPPKEIRHERPPMYRSKHNNKVPPTASTFGHAQTSHPVATNIAGDSVDKVAPIKANRTMGKPPGSLRPDPTSFAKSGTKNEKVKTLAEVKRDQPDLLQPSKLRTKLKPGVPTPEEKPVMNLVTSKNFVVANAVETILAAPKRVTQGAKDYLNKEDFGKVPKYLQHIKQDIDAEYNYIASLQQQEEEMNRSAFAPMAEEDRLEMIEGLKARWEQVNTEYQSGTHITKLDTIGKIKRKEKYEAELSQLEKDIERLNRRNIVVDQMS